MQNCYLHITKIDNDFIEVNSCDGVFTSFGTIRKEDFFDYCDAKADEWLTSHLGNYDGWSKKDRKEMAEKVEVARKEMVAAQKKYRDALGAFCDKYGSYHTTVTGIDAIPTLFSALNPFKFFE